MTTYVGKQHEFIHAIQELIALDYDAMAAYRTAKKRLKNSLYQNQLALFQSDHEDHIKMLVRLLKQKHADIPLGPDTKRFVTQGKVIMASLFGDKMILKAVLSNEDDTNMAYERLNHHPEKWPDADAILSQGLDDVRRHKSWIQNQLS